MKTFYIIRAFKNYQVAI